MFQPISFNVIRQALEWHGFPVPKLRQLSLNDHDPDFVTAEYVAHWTAQQVQRVTGYPPGSQATYAEGEMGARLRQCFCEDVQVADPVNDPVAHMMTALIYVRVPRDLLYWAHLLEEINA